jgi:uracil-DNA glycosylase family 4
MVKTQQRRPNFCAACPIAHVTEGYVPLKVREGHTLVVGEAAGEDEVKSGEGFSGGSGVWLKNMFKLAGQPWTGVSTLNVIGCQPPGNIFPTDPKWYATSREAGRAAVEHCKRHHLWPGVRAAKRAKTYAIGAKALEALTGKHGILTWRGSVLPLLGSTQPTVVPTIHPAALMRQAKLTSVVVRDLRRSLALAPEHYNLFPTMEDVKRFKSKSFAFDFEWNAAGEITICGLSDRFYGAIVVPWREPYISEVRRIFENAEHIIGHNIVGADLPFIERLGWDLSRVQVEDTMLKQHLVQPDYPHDLAFVASVFTNKVFWKGKGWEETVEEGEGEYRGQQWRTWDRPDALPRKLGGYGGCLSQQEAFALYNARDTDAEFQINTPLDAMLKKWDLEPVYKHVSLPAGYICRWMSDRGLKLDTGGLSEIRSVIDTEIAGLEEQLPDGLKPYEEEVGCNLPAPPDTYRAKVKKCKGVKGGKHEVRELLFTAPGVITCPDCGKQHESGKLAVAKIIKSTRLERVAPYNSPQSIQSYVASLRLKEVFDHKTGALTTGKKARQIWAKDHKEFVVLGALKQQITLRNNFAKDSLQGQERMFFGLKVHGTSEGRLSSSGKRKGIDLNIQNQPEHFRTIYVPEREDWGFVNIDISQGESWLTCWLAKDWVRWEKLQDPHYDEHSEIAQAIFNTPVNKKLCKADKAINALRQLGKKINHGRAYGMGAKKQLEDLQTQGYDQFTQSDIREFIEVWKKLNERTAMWQQETMEMAARQGYLRNPFGRVRWFSHRDGTQALAFLPASSLADMVLRMMICHYPGQFLDSIIANGTSVFHPLVDEWIMSIQVHDSLVTQGPWEGHEEQIARSSAIMTQPWPQLDGFAFRVDVKSSKDSWGACS